MTDTTASPAPDADLRMNEPSIVEKVIAETIGTFILVFFGCGAAVMSGGDYVGTAMAFGLALLVGVYSFGRVSGAHFNPAVSVGAALSGRVAWHQVPLYVAGQLLGAILGGLALFVLMHGFDGFDATGNMGQNFFGDEGTGYAVWAALLLEILLTAIFVIVILSVTDGRNQHPSLAPLTIGIALLAIHLVAIPATGTSVNPARSIGPALFAGGDAILQLWLFIVGPLVGAAIAGLVYPLAFGHDTDPVPGSGLFFTRGGGVAAVGGADAYQQQWNQPDAHAATGEGPAEHQAGSGQAQESQQYSSEPIIQDGWQWDPQAQQWIPAPQPTPQQGSAAAEPRVGESPDPQRPTDPEPGRDGEWPEDGATHVKPPDQ